MSEHYFSETPSSDFTQREIEVILAGAPHKVLTAGGVFSPEHLDRGTEVLLHTIDATEAPDTEAAEAPNVADAGAALSAEGQQRAEAAPRSPLLDLGCGWGPIALSAALNDPHREVWAVDINERSRELTRLNAARLNLANVRVAAPDEVPSELRFGAIHSNPPIRVGKEVLHHMLQLWLPRLSADGTALLVVAKHLGADSLQRWIANEFEALEVSRIARDKGFHVIEASRRSS